MNVDPKAPGQRHIAREDSRVGDWVDATTVPEWSAELHSHVFRRRKISIAPVEGDMGGMLPDQFEEWIFVAEHRGDRMIWVRQR